MQGVLRTPEQVLEIGLSRSRVVMMNEAHDGPRRCIRTRQVGQRLLSTAHRLGVRHLALEALWVAALAAHLNETRQVVSGPPIPPLAHPYGYLTQPDMAALVQTALDLGWQLMAYEAAGGLMTPDQLKHPDLEAWRETEQGTNLTAALRSLPDQAPLLVWCGNGHLRRSLPASAAASKSCQPMAVHFEHSAGVTPFCIDQTPTVFGAAKGPVAKLADDLAPELARLGGTAGLLLEEITLPELARLGVDAVLLSLDNRLE